MRRRTPERITSSTPTSDLTPREPDVFTDMARLATAVMLNQPPPADLLNDTTTDGDDCVR